MDRLYRKITTPGGRNRYEESFEFDTGCPAEGLWIVRRRPGSHGATWMTDQVANILGVPRLDDIAWIASHIDDIAEVLDLSLSRGENARRVVAKLLQIAEQANGGEA